MSAQFKNLLEKNPVIAAVKNGEELMEAVESPVMNIFLLGGNICELRQLIHVARKHDKRLYVHMDLVEGLGKDHFAVKYLHDHFKPDGIITTRPNIVKYAKELNMFVIQRFFLLDSRSFDNIRKSLRQLDADAAEVLPGIIPDIISQLSQKSKVPIIAGGMIRTKKEAVAGLKAGAMGISTSCKDVWTM